MPRTLPLFALATLLPVPLLLLGALAGWPWALAAILYITVGVFALDELAPRTPGPAASPAGANALSAILALLHLPLMGLAVLALAGTFGAGPADRLAVFFAFGLWLGQVGNANAHELIHRRHPLLRGLGAAVFTAHLFGHHATAHPAIHHRFVATPDDPNTARRGEGFWRFWPRAAAGSFGAGWRVEAARLIHRGRSPWHPANPYWRYLGGALALMLLALAAAGPAGWAAFVALALYAQMQLMLSDYVQHYGLIRPRGADGRYAPVSPAQSWDAAHWMSGLFTLNAPRHADHHSHATRPFPALAACPDAPRLPGPLPVMATLALIPRAWRRVMDPRLDRLGRAT
jgi:alkane 1-monooxygenase